MRLKLFHGFAHRQKSWLTNLETWQVYGLSGLITAIFVGLTVTFIIFGGVDHWPDSARCEFEDTLTNLFSSSGTGVVFWNIGLIPLLNFAGTDLWETYSGAGVINPWFGIMNGAPIGSLGMFKGGLKKMFPHQVKGLDWTDMDIVGTRERFLWYKQLTNNANQIDPNHSFTGSYFRLSSAKKEWIYEGSKPIEGRDSRPFGEFLHGSNDDLLHLGPDETVVTDSTVDEFNLALFLNAVGYIGIALLSTAATATPVVTTGIYLNEKQLGTRIQSTSSMFGQV